MTELQRLCDRFEIAVENFGRSCINMRANEKAFQAWFACAVVQEFGMSRVYREIHLDKTHLLSLTGPSKLIREDIQKGNELFPDLSISWLPNVDARHTSTRSNDIRHVGEFLSKFAIITEMKITGSTGNSTPKAQIQQDIAKLAWFAQANRIWKARHPDCTDSLVTYAVIMDNHNQARYDQKNISLLLNEVKNNWPSDDEIIPTVILLNKINDKAAISIYRDFELQQSSGQ